MMVVETSTQLDWIFFNKPPPPQKTRDVSFKIQKTGGADFIGYINIIHFSVFLPLITFLTLLYTHPARYA